MTNQTFGVAGYYHTGEETFDETFTNIDEAKAYYEELIVELEEDKESIDYISIFEADEDGASIANIETYTYD